ncbi:hypothetical protein Tsubulata_007628 [Turnera subulata]|uniref:F-box domain-containing protein n=1 Tax=Turnera subulata TaxID=218843 RepID=A0A9Q0JG02_9ROSI|nr:hypothetical protein Tsubulata_007628 [Turnera subulata]
MLSTKRTKTTSSFPSPIDTIANNDDLLKEILLRLPIKSLLKFKTVSKHWLSLISNPHFSRFYRPHSNSPCALFLRSSNRPLNPEYGFYTLQTSTNSNAPFKTLTFTVDSGGIEIIQSCNGLLLCATFRTRYRSKRNYYVYNPTTRHYTTLPHPLPGRISGVSLAFDPSKSPHYKAVCVTNSRSLRNHLQIQIYSSETGPWRTSAVPFTTTGNIEFDCGVFCNGAIHWISDSGRCLYFEVDRELLKEMPMPPIPDGWDQRRVRYFGESRGSLFLVEIYKPPHDHQLEVYELASDYSGWFPKYQVDINAVAAAFPEMGRDYLQDPSILNYYAFQILCVVKGETEDGSYLVLHIPNKLIRYEFKAKRFQKLHDFVLSEKMLHDIPPNGRLLAQESAKHFALCSTYEYIESLASV